MDIYMYDGVVKQFGSIVSTRWQGKTFAASEKKAKSNLAYQYKKQHNLTPSSSITLPGKLVKG